ncbi:MAG: arsenate reductase (glutaredoxin) [Planctomycetaceae bacterium]|nr:arsenate reductase (glutaredoxin) [Planctomycetaceae bacterium]
MQIYHNPRCSKSRQTLELIREAGVEPEVIEYLKTPPSQAELDRILKRLILEPADVMRKKEPEYREFVAGQKLNRKQAIRLLVEHPRLLERPIVVEGDRAVIGRPPENARELL